MNRKFKICILLFTLLSLLGCLGCSGEKLKKEGVPDEKEIKAEDEEEATCAEDSIAVKDLGIPIKQNLELSESVITIPKYTKPVPVSQEEKTRELITAFSLNAAADHIESNWRESGFTYCHDDTWELKVSDYGFKLSRSGGTINSDSEVSETTASENENSGAEYASQEELLQKVSVILKNAGAEDLTVRPCEFSQTNGMSTFFWENAEWSEAEANQYETGYCEICFSGEELELLDYQLVEWSTDGDQQIISEAEAYSRIADTIVYNVPDVETMTVCEGRLEMNEGKVFWVFMIEEKTDWGIRVPAESLDPTGQPALVDENYLGKHYLLGDLIDASLIENADNICANEDGHLRDLNEDELDSPSIIFEVVSN